MRSIIIMSVLFLAACSTPLTTMRKGDAIINCGGGTVGSVTGGYIGYSIQEAHDQECVQRHALDGYKIVTPAE